MSQAVSGVEPEQVAGPPAEPVAGPPAEPAAEAGQRAERRRLMRRTLVCWLGMFLFFGSWSLATPLWTSPDEPAHVLMAYAAGHGELMPERTNVFANGVTSNAITHAPQGIVESAASVSCYAYKPEVSGDCLKDPYDNPTANEYLNPAGRNIPTYYLLTGWPSLLVPIEYAPWAMRLAAIAVASFFAGWAVSAALTRRRPALAVTGVVVATTPQVMYFGGVLNPNSLEICAGMALAACSVVFLQERGTWLGRVMFRRAMIAASVMILIRLLAPAWVAIWFMAFAIVADKQVWRTMVDRRHLGWLIAPIASTVISVAWTFLSGVRGMQAIPMFDLPLQQRLALSKDRIDKQFNEVIGVFGWLDTPLTQPIYTRYLWAGLFVIFAAWVFLSSREAIAAVFLLAMIYVAPIVLQALQWNENGPVWQMRYTLPILVALPIATLMFVGQRADTRAPSALVTRLTWGYSLALLFLASVQIQAFVILLRRNVSGYGGPSIFEGPWYPPVNPRILVTALVAVVLVTVAALLRGYLMESRALRHDGPMVSPS